MDEKKGVEEGWCGLGVEEGWCGLGVGADELRLSTTLTCGQCFQWRPYAGHSDQWVGAVDNTVVVFKQTPSDTLFRLPLQTDPTYPKWVGERLRAYFQLDLGSLPQLTKVWSEGDGTGHFGRCLAKVGGLRLVELEPLDALISFICSSNNNIKRIHSLVDSIRSEYGTYLGTVNDQKFHAFPTFEQLASISLGRLRELGFGYRAKYLYHTVQALRKLGGPKFLQQLKEDAKLSGPEKADVLQKHFMGVGPKVANLIALQSLRAYDCVPIDVHIFRVFSKVYGSKQKGKSGRTKASLTKANYSDISQFFNKTFGKLAGWAQLFLFTNAKS